MLVASVLRTLCLQGQVKVWHERLEWASTRSSAKELEAIEQLQKWSVLYNVLQVRILMQQEWKGLLCCHAAFKPNCWRQESSRTCTPASGDGHQPNALTRLTPPQLHHSSVLGT